MRIPFSLFCSPALTGTSHSSLDYHDLHPTRTFNAGNTQVAINATNGNCHIKDTAFSIQDHECNLTVGMVWNSSDQRWRFSAGAKLALASGLYQFLPQRLVAEIITLTESDGRVVQYMNDDSGRFVCLEPGQEGLSFLTKHAGDNTITRFSPATGVREIYDSTNRLVSKILPGDLIFNYQYDANDEVNCITLPSGRMVKLETDANNTNKRQLTLTGMTQVLACYEFDNIKNPTLLTTQIPQVDKPAYTTSYKSTQVGAEKILEIKSSDATFIALAFNSAGIINKFTEGTQGQPNYRPWTICLDKSARECVVMDADKNVYAVKSDVNNHLASFKTPTGLITQFNCNSQGQLLSVTDPDGYIRLNDYSKETGQLTLSKSANNKSKRFIYNTNVDSMLCGVQLAAVKCESNKQVSHFYVYNAMRQLAYEISPAGRVTHYVYSDEPGKPSHVIAIKKDSKRFYSTTAVNLDDVNSYPTLEALDNWWDQQSALEKRYTQVEKRSYDQFGRCDTLTQFSAVNAEGNGVENNPTNSRIKKSLDATGRVVNTEIAIDYVAATTLSMGLAYDGLSRIIKSTDGIQAKARITAFDYNGNQTTISYPNGLIKTTITDQGGLSAEVKRGSEQIRELRTQHMLRNSNGSLKRIIREDGRKQYDFNDASGRLQYRLFPGGKVAAHEYDVRGQLTCVKNYEVADLNPATPNFNIEELIAQHKKSLHNYELYNEDGQLCFEVTVKKANNATELSGAVVQHLYQLDNRIGTIHYHHLLTQEFLVDISYQKLNLAILAAETLATDDRETRYFYDEDGLLIGEQTYVEAVADADQVQALGYTKEYVRDAAGHIIHELVYRQQSALATDIESARPENAEAWETWYWYDNAGRKMASLDADKILRQFSYYANGKLDAEIIYANKQDAIDVTLASITFPELSATDHVIKHGYDDFGREYKITNFATGLEVTTQYDAQDNEISKTLRDIRTDQSRQMYKAYNIFSEVIAEATPRIAATMADETDKQHWLLHLRHPATGLVISETDAYGKKTLFYYNQNRQPVLKLLPDGAAIEYQYDVLTEKPTSIYRYYSKIESDVLAILRADIQRDGFYDADLFNNILKRDNNLNQEQKYQYDAEGLLLEEMAATSARHTLRYNPFNEVVYEAKQVDASMTLVVEKAYDLRGNCIESVTDRDGLAIKTTKTHADALNRVTEVVDELGAKTQITYPALRQQIHTDLENENRKKILTQDAFMRTQSSTDWSGVNLTRHAYNDETGEHTVIPPEGDARQIIEVVNAFGDRESITQAGLTTRFKHGVDGQLEATIYPNNSQLTHHFDLNGLLETQVAPNGKVKLFKRNLANQIDGIIDDENHDERLTSFTPNVFDVNETEIHPDGLKIENVSKQAGLISETVQDPQQLKLFSQEMRNFSGVLTQIQQGDIDNKNQYQEKIAVDKLGRELTRHIVMDDESLLLLKAQEWDAAGNVTKTTDGKGNAEWHAHDARGNLRFTVDAESFVVEKTYDVNNREMSQRCYSRAIVEDEIQYATAATITDFKLMMAAKAEASDALRYRIYDKDGLPRFELNALENTPSGTIFRIREWRYVNTDKYVQRIDYAYFILYPQAGLDLTSATACAELEKIVQGEFYLDHPRNRVKDVCRDIAGQRVFTRNGEGYVVEKRYDVNGKEVARIRYADQYPQAIFPQDPAVVYANLTINNPKNRAAYSVYDVFGNLRFTVDGEGFLRQYQYDKADRPTFTDCYFHKLSTRLDTETLAGLYAKLGDVKNRCANKLIEAINGLLPVIVDSKRDVQLQDEYDTAGRLQSRVDGEHNGEKFAPNALGLPVNYTDKRGNHWIKRFNRAKHVISEISPKVALSTVTTAANQSLALVGWPEQEVENLHTYDAALNPESLTYANNMSGEARTVINVFDKKNQFVGTKILNVTIDNGTSDQPTPAERPEILQPEITTRRVLDYAVREIVTFNEKDIPQFTVFDCDGRERFRIDQAGFVTEFTYVDGFNESVKITHYEIAISPAEIALHKRGFKLAELQTYIQNLPHANNDTKARSIQNAYDRRGLITLSAKDTITVCRTLADGSVVSELIAPTKAWVHNAFNEIIFERECINSTENRDTYRFQDNNGNEKLTISSNGFVTMAEYGMPHIDTDKKGCIALNRFEFKAAINSNVARDENVITMLKDAPARIFVYDYDKRLLPIATTVKSSEAFYESELQANGMLAKGPAKNSVTILTEYDAAGDVKAYVLDNGDKRFLMRDARGDVMAETEFPLATDVNNKDSNGQPKKSIPYAKHYINAHRQAVGTRTYLNAAIMSDDGSIVAPSASAQDEESLIYMDNRGNAITTQFAEGHLKFMTYDACKQPVRNYQWVAGYSFVAATKTVVFNPHLHLRATRLEYDNRQQISMLAKIDDQTETQTHKQYNAFLECIAEGPSVDTMLVMRAYNKAGYKCYTDEDKGIPTVAFFNAIGEEVVTFRSQHRSLAEYADESAAAKEFLDVDYASIMGDVQRTVLQRDLEGRVTKQFLPWYKAKPKEVPTYKQMSFTLQHNPAGKVGNYIAWRGPEERFLVADFKMRVKGSHDWMSLPEILPDVRPPSPDLDIRYVCVSDYPADNYEYQLDFYYADPDKNLDQNTWPPQLTNLDAYPSYRAHGEVMLDTENYTNSTNPIWYMQDDSTFIIAGKLDDIAGVELINAEGKVYKRLAATNIGNGRLLIDMSEEESGAYDFKFIYGYHLDSAEIGLGQTGDYTFNFYVPAFQFSSPTTIQAVPGRLPPEILSVVGLVSPATVGTPATTFQLGKNDDYPQWVIPSDGLCSSAVYGTDANQKYYYFGRSLNSGHWGVSNPWPAVVKFQADYPSFITEAFLQFKSVGKDQPHALQILDSANRLSVYQLTPWAGDTYILPIKPGTNFSVTANLKATVVSLTNRKSSTIIGNLQVRTQHHAHAIVAKEISITNFTIEQYRACAVHRNQVWINNSDDYFNYSWATSAPSNHRLYVTHSGVNAIINDISTLPRDRINQPMFYQAKLAPMVRTMPNAMNLSLEVYGDVIPMAVNAWPRYQPVNGPQINLITYSNANALDMKHLDTSYYPDMYAVYLSSLPQGLVGLEFAIQVNTSLGKENWVPPYYQLSASRMGLVIRPGNIQPGIYQYRLRIWDAQNQFFDLQSLGLEKNAENWYQGSIELRMGLKGYQIFTSKNEKQIREIVMPIAACEMDRWNNQTQIINRANYAQGILENNLEKMTEYREYNLFDQTIRTISPEVEVTDEHGQSEMCRLITETLYNTNNKKIGEINTTDKERGNKGKLRFPNNQGDTLLEIDEDDIARETTIDMLRRKTSTVSGSSGRTYSAYERNGLLTLETRSQPDGTREVLEKNVEKNCIRSQDALGRNSFSDFDFDGHEILHINVDLTARLQQFDARTGLRLAVIDEDNNVQTWRTTPNDPTIPVDPKDAYHGTVRSYRDLAGQVIDYMLNFNKQILHEKGNLAGVTKSRGEDSHVPDSQQSGPPPAAHEIKNFYNEAGLLEEINDFGAKLVTRMSHDQDDYVTVWYFTNNDGRVYQATYTDYDALHRAVRLHDTRFMVHMGYDQKSNRRFAHAFVMGDDARDKAFLRESWFSYTPANRPIVRDGVLKDGVITIAPAQGTQFAVVNGQIQRLVTKTSNNELREQRLGYKPGDILQNIDTVDLTTQKLVASMRRELDEAKRCKSVTQVTHCDVYLNVNQPDKPEYVGFQLPTLFLSLNGSNMVLYRYATGQEPLLIDFDGDDQLHKQLGPFRHVHYDQIKSTPSETFIKALINEYNERVFGSTVTNINEFFPGSDIIRKQTTIEKKGEKTSVREIVQKTAAGRPLEELTTLKDHLNDEEKTGYTIKDISKTDYYFGDSVAVQKITTDRSVDVSDEVKVKQMPAKAQVYTTENSNGMVTTVQGSLLADEQGQIEGFRGFVVNSKNCIVFKESAKGRNYYFYAQKKPTSSEDEKIILVAFVGDLPEEIKMGFKGKSAIKKSQAISEANRPAVMNVDINHQALSTQFPPPLSSEYCVTRDMTYTQLAEELNYTGYAAAIAHANQADVDTVIKANSRVKIPPLYFEVNETAWNGGLPSIERIIGNLYPSMPVPHFELKPKKVDELEIFLQAAACVAVMAFAPEVFACMMGATLGSLTVASTASLGVTMSAYGAAGAASNLLSQGIAIGFGSQKSIDFKALAINTISSAVSAGVVRQIGPASLAPTLLRKSVVGSVVTNVVRAEAVAFAQQAALMSVRLQRRFDWAQMSTAAFNAVVNAGADEVFGKNTSKDGLPAADLAHASASMTNKVASAGVNTLVNSLGDAAIRHQAISAKGLAANVVGNMVGTYVGDRELERILDRQQEAREMERVGRHAVAGMGEKRGGARLFAASKPVVRKEKLDAVKEAKRSRVERWKGAAAGGSGRWVAHQNESSSDSNALDIFGNGALARTLDEAGEISRTPEIAKGENKNSWHLLTRGLGVVQAIGGASEVVGGVTIGVGGAATGVGLVIGGLMAGNGLDNFRAGVMAAIRGEYQDTTFAMVVKSFGASDNATMWMEMGLGAGTLGGAGVGRLALRLEGSRLGLFGREFTDVLGGESVAKTVRFKELASGTKADVRALLKSGTLDLPAEQIDKILYNLGSGRMDKVTLKLMNTGDVRIAAERAGRTSGYQRMTFEVDQMGRNNKVVQTAFDDANKLVPQKPCQSKNNLYDVKKWNKNTY